MTTWFIADLHLDPKRPQALLHLESFFTYLKQHKAKTDALYILGDFFEYWIGDDVLEHPLGAPYQLVIKQLQDLSQAGIPIYFQHGNRDFLIQETFAQAAGMTLLPEKHVIDLYGTGTLLMHGDSLCTDDVAYQQVRPMLRDPAWQANFLSLSIEERIAQAQAMREQSKTTTQNTASDILDVTQTAVLDVLEKHQVTQLIHGHTHRPARHLFEHNAQTYLRVVLGDWYKEASYLPVTQQGVKQLLSRNLKKAF